MMCQYGFGNNTDFDKLRDYVIFLVHNTEPLSISEIADDLGISNKTITKYNKKLSSSDKPLLLIKTRMMVKDMKGEEKEITLDDYEGWRTNWIAITRRLRHTINSTDLDKNSTIKFKIDKDGNHADWYLSNDVLPSSLVTEINIFNGDKINGFIFKYMRQWSIESFGWKNLYPKFMYTINKRVIDDNFLDLLIDDDLVNFLEENLDTPLDKEIKNKLIDLVDVRVDGKRKRSINAINLGLCERNLPYCITQRRIRNIRFWIINRT